MYQLSTAALVALNVFLMASLNVGVNGQNEIVPSSIESPNPVEVGQDREEAHVVGANKILCSISMGDSSCVQLITGCYCLVKKQMPWSEAFRYCESYGKSLLSVNSLPKQLDLQVNMQRIVGSSNIATQVGVWTSGTYVTILRTFFWAATGEIITPIFGNWQAGEPNNQGPSDCVRLIPDGNAYWADLNCGQYLPFICESLL